MTPQQAESYIWLYDKSLETIRQGYRWGPLTELRDEAQRVLDDYEKE